MYFILSYRLPLPWSRNYTSTVKVKQGYHSTRLLHGIDNPNEDQTEEPDDDPNENTNDVTNVDPTEDNNDGLNL